MRSVRRIALLSLTAAVMLAAAAVALGGPNDPRLQRRPADVKRAKTLILKRGDLPGGFVDKGPQQQDSNPTPDLPCAQPDLHTFVMTADVDSHNFVRKHPGAYAAAESEATFFLRPAQAQRIVAIMTSHKIGRCLKSAVIKSVNKSANGKFKIVTARLVPLSENVGDLHAKFWDMLVTFRAHGLLFHDELVLAFLRRGRVVSSLMINTLNGLTEEEARTISERLTLRLEALPKSAVR
jgi:hypothetical protein